MRVHFSTDDVPPREREQFWLDVFAKQVMRVTPSDRSDLATFRAQLEAQIVGRFTLLDFQTTHRTGVRTAADAHRDNSDRFQLRRVRSEQLYTTGPARARSERVPLAAGDSVSVLANGHMSGKPKMGHLRVPC